MISLLFTVSSLLTFLLTNKERAKQRGWWDSPEPVSACAASVFSSVKPEQGNVSQGTLWRLNNETLILGKHTAH